MKRFHVHLHVDDLTRSIEFYSRLFAAEPTRSEADYAKWMLADPPVNFAISTRGEHPGLDHFGIQTDNVEELDELKQRARVADEDLLDEGATTCCYARSEKHWVTDPQGIAWEHFHTLADIPVFREKRDAQASGMCCAPNLLEESQASLATASAASRPPCCTPATASAVSAQPCC